MKALGKGSVASMVEVGLTIAWWALWVALIGVLLLGVGYGAFLALVAGGSINPDALGTEGDGLHLRVGDSTIIAYDNVADAWPILGPSLLIGLVVVTGALVIVGRLRRLFSSFTSGEPFRRENAAHLRIIWITMLLIEVGRYLLLGIMAGLFAAIGAPAGASADFDINIDISTWMSIAILIVLAEVFREGARMKEEQELTI